ncbi:YicC family protein [Lujinxingia litoralis]|uniref:YicC family protein n=1 Tax=Lujinxingia litoralis TaxID=2211119 RepID=A0A328CA22_9DELT|nr:YicC/YloC family endoribonuclease [Lujinxingia litoralis]RAL25487.1 YicC family protein [Lujinxingia litoralis]
MPVFSMTGFGAARLEVEGRSLRVECKSVNHRTLEVRVHAPRELRWLEAHVVRAARARLERGRVDVRLEIGDSSQTEGGFSAIDQTRFEAVAQELKRLAVASGLGSSVQVSDVLAYRSYFERDDASRFDESALGRLLPTVEEALAYLHQAREEEGRGIEADLRGHLATLAARIDAVEALESGDELAYRSRVEARLRQAIDDFGVGELDEERLAQELVYYAERGDISEELQRARSHVARLGTVLDEASEQGVGKKIDFYLQELIREVNTMGSKSHLATQSDLVVEMKSAIEKMREQSANVA